MWHTGTVFAAGASAGDTRGQVQVYTPGVAEGKDGMRRAGGAVVEPAFPYGGRPELARRRRPPIPRVVGGDTVQVVVVRPSHREELGHELARVLEEPLVDELVVGDGGRDHLAVD